MEGGELQLADIELSTPQSPEGTHRAGEQMHGQALHAQQFLGSTTEVLHCTFPRTKTLFQKQNMVIAPSYV